MKKGRHQKIGSLNPADIAPSGLSFALACCIYRGRPQADLTDIHDPSLLPSDRSLSKRDSPRPIESRDGHSHSHTKTTLIIDSRPIRADKNSSGRAPRPSLSESHQFQFAASSYSIIPVLQLVSRTKYGLPRSSPPKAAVRTRFRRTADCTLHAARCSCGQRRLCSTDSRAVQRDGTLLSVCGQPGAGQAICRDPSSIQ
jgi:hypothetical protein